MFGRFRIAYYISPSDDRTSFIRAHNTGKHAQGRSFARTVRPHQTKDLCRTNIEAEVIDCSDSRKLLRESFSMIADWGWASISVAVRCLGFALYSTPV
jgi:hypothetical protein